MGAGRRADDRRRFGYRSLWGARLSLSGCLEGDAPTRQEGFDLRLADLRPAADRVSCLTYFIGTKGIFHRLHHNCNHSFNFGRWTYLTGRVGLQVVPDSPGLDSLENGRISSASRWCTLFSTLGKPHLLDDCLAKWYTRRLIIVVAPRASYLMMGPPEQSSRWPTQTMLCF